MQVMSLDLFDFDYNDTSLVYCGADEAGRGPIAGSVFAAAVIIDPTRPIIGLRDSKKLSEQKREALAIEIREKALACAVSVASIEEIDELNILWASMLAMKRAIESLEVAPQMALIDGNKIPKGLKIPAQAIVKGDDKVPAISAASILAKTARDSYMMRLHEQYPQYAFNKHKGYPTALHLKLLREYGISPVHRKSFGPVKKLLSQE